jgi:hypothetical protein
MKIGGSFFIAYKEGRAEAFLRERRSKFLFEGSSMQKI